MAEPYQAEPANHRFREYPFMDSDFRAHVIQGLKTSPKQLSPKYFYDARGSVLFDRITRLKEYYPAETEKGIYADHIEDIARALPDERLLVEPGSGNSEKVALLLERLPALQCYVPIEISGEHLYRHSLELSRQYPQIQIHAVAADFTTDRICIREERDRYGPPVIFFPGSTIGNFSPGQAVELLRGFSTMAGHKGRLLIGVDLKKDPKVLEQAYNDSQGVTAEFNLNILHRVKYELNGEVDLDGFAHEAIYNEQMGRVEMHLRSRRRQQIRLDRQTFTFREGETIHTENSHKYTVGEFQELAGRAGYRLRNVWTDENNYFSVQLFDAGMA